MTRENFDKHLAELKGKLVALGSMVAKAQENSVAALADRNVELAQEVIQGDKDVNHLQKEIEEECLLLIAREAPVARDLRTIFAISSIAWELERMADHCSGVASLSIRLGDQPLLKPLIDIPQMAIIGREMLMGVLDSFVKGDESAARQIAVRDTDVDELNEQVFRELLVLMMTDPRTITRATYILWVSHNLERFADRVTNIAERVVFLLAGDMVELNE